MADNKTDLILHPIRMRIIQAFITGQKRTTQQLLKQLENVPQATMYRHLNKLLEAGIIEVAEENKIRGAYEKVYFLAQGGGDMNPTDLTQQSASYHMEIFLKFVATLIGDFSAYVGQERYNMLQDGISFRQAHAYLTDEEYANYLKEMREPLQRVIDNEPSEDRRRRVISTIVIPEAKSTSTAESKTPKREEEHNDHSD